MEKLTEDQIKKIEDWLQTPNQDWIKKFHIIFDEMKRTREEENKLIKLSKKLEENLGLGKKIF